MRSPLVLVGVILAVAALVAAFMVIGAQPTQTQVATTGDSNAAAVTASVTGLPQSELDSIGSGGLASPLTAIAGTPLASRRPLILYMSAEYCPFCAAGRWSVVQALGRFGSFSNLSLTTSSSTDRYPDTASLSFRSSSYSSQWIDVVAFETADRQHQPLQAIPAAVAPMVARFDSSQAIPFLYIDGRYGALGSNYLPTVMQGLSWTEIAQRLRDPTSVVARNVVGNANQLTAAICQSTRGQPVSVCDTAAVRQVTLPQR